MEGPWPLLLGTTSLLGMRHGLDLDHLATIDAMTRSLQAPYAKRAGFLFSLGHGFVVIAIALLVGACPMEMPSWLESLGAWISIFFLFLFGVLNLWSVFSPEWRKSAPRGLRSLVLKKIATSSLHPWGIVAIGALFAVSFDTLCLVAMFSLSGSAVALGIAFSAFLGVSFMLGMMITDGLNGWLVGSLVARADALSLRISRGLGLAITFFSLILCGLSFYNRVFS